MPPWLRHWPTEVWHINISGITFYQRAEKKRAVRVSEDIMYAANDSLLSFAPVYGSTI